MVHEIPAEQLAKAPFGSCAPAFDDFPAGAGAKRLDRRQQVGYPGGSRRHRSHDRWTPLCVAPLLQRQHRVDRRRHPIGAFPIGLVDHEDIGDLHDAGLQGLHLIAGAGHERHNRHIRGAHDVHFVLPDSDGLNDDDVVPGRVEDDGGFGGRPREASQMASRRHAADKHALVFGVRLHAHAVAQNRSAAVRARRIDAQHADGTPALANLCREPVHERALAGARRSGDADEIRASGVLEDAADEARAFGRFVFDQGNGARDRARIARQQAVGKRRKGHDQRPISCRPITRRWISLVPSPIVQSLTSRKNFSAG